MRIPLPTPVPIIPLLTSAFKRENTPPPQSLHPICNLTTYISIYIHLFLCLLLLLLSLFTFLPPSIHLRLWRLKPHGPGSYFNASILTSQFCSSLVDTQVATTHLTSCFVLRVPFLSSHPGSGKLRPVPIAHTNTRSHPHI